MNTSRILFNLFINNQQYYVNWIKEEFEEQILV